jgi:hypothetical protein
MNRFAETAEELKRNLVTYQELLAVVEAEGRSLRADDAGTNNPLTGTDTRKELLPRLNNSLENLKRHRLAWQQAGSQEREANDEMAALLRRSQDLIMKIIMQDRENEQALLRRGLLPPKHLPAANRQRPHFVADMYRRQSGSQANT